MEWLNIFNHSYTEGQRFLGGHESSKLMFVCDFFEITTYDDDMSELFATKALEVAEAITEGKTYEYIKDPENHRWYLWICNLPFFAEKIEWGTSIRGAWWDFEITVETIELFDGEKQLMDPIEFTQETWKDFMRTLIVWAKEESPQK